MPYRRNQAVLGAVLGTMLALCPGESAEPPAPGASASPACRLLDQLIRRPEQVSVQQFSSRNKKGLNGDANWPLYKDRHGDDVIFDASGPGCVKSMWATDIDPSAVFKFYFDGEEAPRLKIPCLDFYQGKHPLFPAPLASYERRGY